MASAYPIASAYGFSSTTGRKIFTAWWDTTAAPMASTSAIVSFHGRVFSLTRAT